MGSLATQMTEISSITLDRVHYVGSGDYHLIELHPYALWEPNQLLDSGVVSRDSITTQSNLLTRITKCLITPPFQLRLAYFFQDQLTFPRAISACYSYVSGMLTARETSKAMLAGRGLK